MRFSDITFEGRRLWALAACIALALCAFGAVLPRFAFADAEAPSIVYDGDACQLTVQGAPGYESSSDLFPSFKGLMPGDMASQDIALEAKGVHSQVRLYVRAVVSDDAQKALEPIVLTSSVDKEGLGKAIQSGSVGHAFSESTQVAQFSEDGSAVLHLSLDVPTSVSNELAGKSEQVTWLVTAEDDSGTIAADNVSAGPEDLRENAPAFFSSPIKTGDLLRTVPVLLLVIACLSAVIAITAWARRKRHQ